MTEPSGSGPYSATYRHYWEAGWRGILPLPPARKKPVPRGYTGYDGAFPSYADLSAWAEAHPFGNICLRLPPTVIGLDVDAYGGKTGGLTLAHAESLWGALPPTIRSTSRNDPISGIRLYRVPAGVHLQTVLQFPDQAIGNIEIIQHSHRYALVWPSIHDEPEHRTYRWLTHDGFVTDEIPTPESLPDLPPRWLTAITAQAVGPLGDHVSVATALAAMPQGPPNAAVSDRFAEAVRGLHGPVGGRHDVTLGHVLGLLRLAEQGCAGVDAALLQLRPLWCAAVTEDGSRTDAAAYAEFDRMVTGQRGHDLIAATPSPDHRAEAQELRQLAGLLTAEGETSFWDARVQLGTIRQFALARMCSPWAVLGAVLLRVGTTIPPHVTLPPLVGGRGSLNLFACLVGPSGGGKGAAETAACDVYPGPRGAGGIYVSTIGSAEGISHMYKHRDKGELIEDRNAVMFNIPEIDTLLAIGARSGSALMPALRNAYTGDDLSFAWADANKRLPMAKHSYRLTMLIGVQPDHAAPLLADASGGFPQRCIWLPSTDPGISVDVPDEPYPLACFAGNNWAGSFNDSMLQLPAEAVHAIRTARAARGRGETGVALDGHALFTRAKVAVMLAVLDLRAEVNSTDWELAGVVMRCSDRTRTEVEDVIAASAREANTVKGLAAGHQQLIAESIVADACVVRIGRRIVALLDRHGPLHRNELRKWLRSTDRQFFEEAMEAQIVAGTVGIEDGRFTAV